MRIYIASNSWVLLASCLLGLAGCGSHGLRDEPAPWPPALALMAQVWEGIRGDQDAKDVAACDLAFQMAKLGYPKSAMKYLQGTDSHRGLVGMAQLALDYAHQGDRKLARVYLAEAQAGSDRFLISRPRDLCMRMTQAYVATGQPAMAEDWRERLADAEDLAVVKSLIQAEELRQGRIFLEQVEARTEPELMEVLVAQMRKGKPSEIHIAGLIKNVENRVDGMYPVDRIQGYLLLASAAREWGRVEDCERMMMKAEGISLEISPRIEASTLARISVADAYVDTGNLEKAQVWIRKAQDSLPQNPYLAQPKACAKLAEVVWRTGNQEQAKGLWTEALNRARTHLHPRARRLGTMAVLESLLQSQVALSPEQEKMVLSVIQEEVQPPPLATNQLEDYLQEAGISVPDSKEKGMKKKQEKAGKSRTQER